MIPNQLVVCLFVYLIDEIKKFEQDQDYTIEKEKKEVQEKVNKSDYLSQAHKDKRQHIMKIGERKASLQHRMETLVQKREDIDKKLQNNRSERQIDPPSNIKLSQSDYLVAGKDILNQSNSTVNENNIRKNQERIKQLIRDRQKTLEEYSENQDEDNLDVNEKEYDSQFYGIFV